MTKTFRDLPFGQKPEIKLGKYPDKGICLTFSAHTFDPANGYSFWLFKELVESMVSWLNYHSTDSKSPLYDDLKIANFFIQSRSDTFLMLEFWTSAPHHERVHNFVNLLRGKFEFNFEPV